MRRLLILLPLLAGAAAEAALPEGVFARVDGREITIAEYRQALAQAARERYYHFQPPEEEMARFRREVGQRLIDRVLLAAEAERRGVGPDREAVARRIEALARRYEGSPMWERIRRERLPALQAALEAESRLQRLEAEVKGAVKVTDEEVRAYYRAHPDKFTTPERVRVSLILLRVDPGAPSEQWLKRRDEAAALVRRLREGEDFAALAREHSEDPDSAGRGGDMGYLHRGMLSGPVEEALAKLEVGQISEPVQLLEGWAILRLEGRIEPRLNPYEQVQERARELLLRERREAAWTRFKEGLREKAAIEVDERVYGGGDGV
ncbi:peptidylprolyl isomerase [Inmirania thermothiophila]|uniref:peptidylprolyl isomerase n=1 Tax=Inmirania thermothiophila TaxID=1750597 RepID=A0A3N1Y5N1_9GAMM|nr:peptidyl-prolyl cis-trans isomerase [Inmirania thermothiophila]ROR32922.1 periplasmic chaperone for outer membrane proteins SurA [Inmirania thermothiophila]